MKWYFIRTPTSNDGQLVRAFDREDALFRAAGFFFGVARVPWDIDDLIVREVVSIDGYSLLSAAIKHFPEASTYYAQIKDITLKV